MALQSLVLQAAGSRWSSHAATPWPFILQGNLASNDEEQEDQVSQGTARSYSSVAPLGLPAGDQGIDSYHSLSRCWLRCLVHFLQFGFSCSNDCIHVL